MDPRPLPSPKRLGPDAKKPIQVPLPLMEEPPLERVYSAIKGEVTRFDKTADDHELRIRELLSGLSAAEINNLRYRMFAPHYDAHMEDHERAIALLLHQLIAVQTMGFPRTNRIIRGDILEMSCGTGTVIKRLFDALPFGMATGLDITANDLSDEMKAIAEVKLKGLPCALSFAGQDISVMEFDRLFGTVILSQTLHLITDEDVMRQERQDNYMHVDEKRHIDAKFRVVERAYDHLEPNGTLIVIDEWPAMLSDRGGPLGAGFAYLFKDGLRQIHYSDFRDSIIGVLPGSRFVTQLKVPIDSKHVMHLIAIRKDADKPGSKGRLPAVPGNDVVRNAVCMRIVTLFKAMGRRFIEGFEPADGSKPWVKLLPIDRRSIFRAKVGGMPTGEFQYNSVVMDRMMHHLNDSERFEAISRAIESLRMGGSLIIVDEWDPPKGAKNRIDKSVLTGAYMNRFRKHLIYAGAVRLPIKPPYSSGMYGYLYRKVF